MQIMHFKISKFLLLKQKERNQSRSLRPFVGSKHDHTYIEYSTYRVSTVWLIFAVSNERAKNIGESRNPMTFLKRF